MQGAVEMSDGAIVAVNFHGDTLDCVQRDGRVWVSIRRVCESLGVQMNGQLEKLKGKAWACMQMICTHDTSGRMQDIAMLDLDSLPMWLATIEPSRVDTEIREKLERYQVECARVLRDHFFGASAIGEVSLTELSLDGFTAAQLQAVSAIVASVLITQNRLRVLEQAVDRFSKNAPVVTPAIAPKGFFSVLDWAQLHGRKMTVREASEYAAQLNEVCRTDGIVVQTAMDSRFGLLYAYPEVVLEEHFEQIDSKIQLARVCEMLLKWIRHHAAKASEPFTFRRSTVWRHLRRQFNCPEDIERPLNRLEQQGFIRRVTESTASHRGTTLYQVQPQTFEVADHGEDNEALPELPDLR